MESIAPEPIVSKKKRGEVREDGMVYWGKASNGKEQWFSREEFDIRYEKFKSYKKAQYQKIVAANPEIYRGYSRKFAAKHPEKKKECYNNWRKKNMERCAADARKWAAANPEKTKQWRRDRENKRRAEDPLFAMKKRLSVRIRHAFRSVGLVKGDLTYDLLGCDGQFLRDHIASTFTEGMSFDNRHLWQIDHVIPLASAKTEEDLVRLCHWSNLQALWTPDNRRKGDKMPEDRKIPVDEVA